MKKKVMTDKRLWHYKKEVYVEKSGHEGKNRVEVGIREKNVQGGVQDQGGYRTTVFTVVLNKFRSIVSERKKQKGRKMAA